MAKSKMGRKSASASHNECCSWSEGLSATMRTGIALMVFGLVATGCSLFQDAEDSSPGATGVDGTGESVEGTVPAESTLPPLLGLDELAADPVFDGGNADREATAAMQLLLDNELDFNAAGIADGVGECSAINSGLLAEFLGKDVAVAAERVGLTPAPYLTCQLTDPTSAGTVVGYIHTAPDDGGFTEWFLTNPASELTAVISPGDTAGWSEGNRATEFFSIVIVEQGGTQVAIEFRNANGGEFTPGRVPGMIGALSQATADLAG